MTRETELRKESQNNTKRIIKAFLKDKKGLERLSKEVHWLYNTPDNLVEMVFNAGKKQGITETNAKWKQAVQKLLERKFFTNEWSEVVAVYTVKEIFGGLAE